MTTTDTERKIASLTEPGTSLGRKMTFWIGAIMFAVPPPRAIAAVAGDAVQIAVLLAALTIPLILLRASADWTHINKLGSAIFERVSNRRREAIEILIANMVRFGWVIIWFLLSKGLYAWFAGKHIHELLICRPADGVAGGVLFLTISKARFLVTMVCHAVLDTWAKSIIDELPIGRDDKR